MIESINTTSDGKFYSGMTQQEAYADKELLDLFSFADKNTDKVIDDAEIERYNGPILLENIETKKGRFIGTYNGFSGYYYSSENVSGNIISTNEVEYYPGLTLDELDERASINTFRNLDYNIDGKLSKEEIENYKDFAKYTQEMNKFEKQKNNPIYTTFCGGMLGTFISGSIASFFATAAIGTGAGLLAMPVMGLVGGIIGYCVSKYKNHKIEQQQAELTKQYNEQEASKIKFDYNSNIIVE